MIAGIVPLVALVVIKVVIPYMAMDILTILILSFVVGLTAIAAFLLVGFGIDTIENAFDK